MIKTICFCVVLSVSVIINLTGQQLFTLDASHNSRPVQSGHLKMGNPGVPGMEILVNNQYMTIAGKPVIPVMGEFHYSRYPREQWEDIILKMKAGGVNIIATYVFWIHHEEIEGQFEWSGNKDLRAFVKLCHQHGLLVYPRLGPWCHGEARNGGTPDWILLKTNIKDRENHPVYQQYVNRWFEQISHQLKGLYYKDGGPVIGVQLENEYGRGKAGEEHILWLKKTAMKYGIDVPLYTVTGWGNASVPQDEVIPLWGAYPEAPWDSNLERSSTNESFAFYAPMNDEHIGNDLAKKENSYEVNYSRYPFFTCELGLGNQITEHRRPIIDKMDGLALMLNRVATGSNLVGYYVFAGGLNPVGTLTSMEENKDETSYWCELPDISYDFQTAIRESGELADSYNKVKKVHYFLSEFGDILAPMHSVLYKTKDSGKELQLAVRSKDDSGFLFGLNYYRGVQKPVQKNCRFTIKLKTETLTFPQQALDIPDSSSFIWPLNFSLEGIKLKYATAQLICHIGNNWIFYANNGILPQFCLESSAVKSVETSTSKVELVNNLYYISEIQPGAGNYIRITGKDGSQQQIVVLTESEADHAWLFRESTSDQMIISDAGVYRNGNHLHFFGKKNILNFQVLGLRTDLNMDNHLMKAQVKGLFSEFQVQVPERNISPEFQPLNTLDEAQWLKTSVNNYTPSNQLYHKLFMKEFSLKNPSVIKSAFLYIGTSVPCKIRINDQWINQQPEAGKINRLDITGYVHKGENNCLLDYLFAPGKEGFAAKIEVEYYNTDEVVLVSDLSWLTVESYTLPSGFVKMSGWTAPEGIPPLNISALNFSPLYSEWMVNVPNGFLNGLNDMYLYLDYFGDKGRIRLNHHLIYDNFNNGTTWSMELKRFENPIEGQAMKLQLSPLNPDYKILFDKEPSKMYWGKAEIKNIRLVPEYGFDLYLK